MNGGRWRTMNLAGWFVLVLLGIFVWLEAGRQAAAWRRSAATAKECQRLAGEIELLRKRPRLAGLAADSPRAITSRAEEALRLAELPVASLVRIEPQSPVRLGDSAYLLRPTRLELRRVTLEQAIRFAYHMAEEGQGASIRDLRLTALEEPGDPANQGLWNAEAVLTQLIFSPIRR
ncbi:MAG: hypothetical protein ACOY3P_01120 [Planctomycetota bacterium]